MTKILAIQGSDLKRVNLKTDTTILLATEAQKRGYKIFYFEPENLSFLNVKVIALCKNIKIDYSKKKFYSLLKTIHFNLEKSKVILIRNDPPFDNQYFYTTFLLNHISKKVKIINHPFAVRNVSEKLFSINFIKNKKTRAEMLIEQFNKTNNLNFLVNHDENFSYSGF